MIRFLARLEKMKLIEWLPGDKVILLVSGEPTWRKNGPLSTKIRPEIQNAFLQSSEGPKANFLLHDYLADDLLTLKSKIDDCLQFARQANKRAKRRSHEAKPHGLFISLQNFKWSLEAYLTGD
ncbi:MAG: hypothetical protein EOP05_16345 [Proteobacteria bacterium]|nr:MAG: hypothetical protein EOP05_16345 [Pseudomonadota bacterium]